MSKAREKILARVRDGLGADEEDEVRRARVAARLAAHERGPVPARAPGDGAAPRVLFEKMAVGADATVETVASPGDVPDAVARYLQARNLPMALRTGDDGLIAGLPWEGAAMLSRSQGPAHESDPVGLSVASAAAAETGTLMLSSGPDNPTSLNFLPETHIVLVPASRIHGAYEDCWDALRAAHGPGGMPRAVNLITGPSRTADIEQTLLMGAHGPKRLHVIVIEGA